MVNALPQGADATTETAIRDAIASAILQVYLQSGLTVVSVRQITQLLMDVTVGAKISAATAAQIVEFLSSLGDIVQDDANPVDPQIINDMAALAVLCTTKAGTALDTYTRDSAFATFLSAAAALVAGSGVNGFPKSLPLNGVSMAATRITYAYAINEQHKVALPQSSVVLDLDRDFEPPGGFGCRSFDLFAAALPDNPFQWDKDINNDVVGAAIALGAASPCNTASGDDDDAPSSFSVAVELTVPTAALHDDKHLRCLQWDPMSGVLTTQGIQTIAANAATGQVVCQVNGMGVFTVEAIAGGHPNPPEDGKHPTPAAIAVIVLACLAVVGGGIAGVIFYRRRRRRGQWERHRKCETCLLLPT